MAPISRLGAGLKVFPRDTLRRIPYFARNSWKESHVPRLHYEQIRGCASTCPKLDVSKRDIFTETMLMSFLPRASAFW